MRIDTFNFNDISIDENTYINIFKCLYTNSIDFEYNVQYLHNKGDVFVIHNIKVDSNYVVIELAKNLLLKLKVKNNEIYSVCQ